MLIITLYLVYHLFEGNTKKKIIQDQYGHNLTRTFSPEGHEFYKLGKTFLLIIATQIKVLKPCFVPLSHFKHIQVKSSSAKK